jgi:hypothetical protein
LEVTLIGTIIQSDQNLAILADSSGKYDVKGIGEPLELSPEGITVESIQSEQVTLNYQGRRSVVQLDRGFKRPGAAGKSKAGGGRRAKDRGKNR